MVRAYISKYNLGSSDFYRKKNAGIIMHPTKGPFAHVSYNGRVWEGSNVASLTRSEITDLTKNDY